MCWNPKYAVLLLISTLITYLSGSGLQYIENSTEILKKTKWKKIVVAFSLCSNLGILAYFKYTNFLIDSINGVFCLLNVAPINRAFDIVLPVGISFYTFQALSYTLDVYRGDIYHEKNFLKYALFVSFFPQLVAGPIERSKNLLKQINQEHKFDLKRVHQGLTLMLFGLFQKMVISDNVAMIVDKVYNSYEKFDSIELIFATILFAVQIYCDFGGYSNIAIGAAKVMGFNLMENFDTPYLADSVTGFWKRWHISLTSWFRDYLYIPLGGNRKGKLRKYINILIVFLTSGLWHGANWHFVAWGGLNGFYQIVEDLTKNMREKIAKRLHLKCGTWSHKLLKVVISFALVDVSWIFFRAKSLHQAREIIYRMLTRVYFADLMDGSLVNLAINPMHMNIIVISLGILLLYDICKYKKIDLVEKVCVQNIWFQYIVYLSLIFSILLFGVYGPGFDESQFIYFQF